MDSSAVTTRRDYHTHTPAQMAQRGRLLIEVRGECSLVDELFLAARISPDPVDVREAHQLPHRGGEYMRWTVDGRRWHIAPPPKS